MQIYRIIALLALKNLLIDIAAVCSAAIFLRLAIRLQ